MIEVALLKQFGSKPNDDALVVITVGRLSGGIPLITSSKFNGHCLCEQHGSFGTPAVGNNQLLTTLSVSNGLV